MVEDEVASARNRVTGEARLDHGLVAGTAVVELGVAHPPVEAYLREFLTMNYIPFFGLPATND